MYTTGQEEEGAGDGGVVAGEEHRELGGATVHTKVHLILTTWLDLDIEVVLVDDLEGADTFDDGVWPCVWRDAVCLGRTVGREAPVPGIAEELAELGPVVIRGDTAMEGQDRLPCSRVVAEGLFL